MKNKRMLLAVTSIIIVLALAIWGVKRFAAPMPPAIVSIPQAPLESRVASALGAFVVAKFEVNRELPAGTTITQWVEYYQKGSRVDVLPGAPLDIPREHGVTLMFAEKNMPIMLAAEKVGEQQEWCLFAGSFMRRFIMPYKRATSFGMTARNEDARLVYGEPIMLFYGISHSEGISQPEGIQDFAGERFSDEFIEYWLDNDDVFVFKVQIDLPDK